MGAVVSADSVFSGATWDSVLAKGEQVVDARLVQQLNYLGFATMTRVQAQCARHIMMQQQHTQTEARGNASASEKQKKSVGPADLMVRAPTGSGKTL